MLQCHITGGLTESIYPPSDHFCCYNSIRSGTYRDGRSSEDYVKEVLGLSVGMKVESIISFGYADEEKPPVPREQLDYQKVIFSR